MLCTRNACNCCCWHLFKRNVHSESVKHHEHPSTFTNQVVEVHEQVSHSSGGAFMEVCTGASGQTCLAISWHTLICRSHLMLQSQKIRGFTAATKRFVCWTHFFLVWCDTSSIALIPDQDIDLTQDDSLRHLSSIGNGVQLLKISLTEISRCSHWLGWYLRPLACRFCATWRPLITNFKSQWSPSIGTRS